MTFVSDSSTPRSRTEVISLLGFNTSWFNKVLELDSSSIYMLTALLINVTYWVNQTSMYQLKSEKRVKAMSCYFP